MSCRERVNLDLELWVGRRSVPAGADTAVEGHGFCGYTFFEHCQHRTACAKCDFYTPKDSAKCQLLEAKDSLLRMLAAIPLSDEGCDAVDDGQAALDKLLDRLADVPAPARPAPRQISIPAQATLLPAIEINRKPT